MKIKQILKWEKLKENEFLINNLRLFSLFFLGFLIGIIFKTQALKTTVIGFDDHRALNSDEIQLKD